ncbi:MAG: hypothetical protein ACXWC3_23405, partial [Burkholderiales bacterium]
RGRPGRRGFAAGENDQGSENNQRTAACINHHFSYAAFHDASAFSVPRIELEPLTLLRQRGR